MSSREVNSSVKRFGDFTAVDAVEIKVEDGLNFGRLGPYVTDGTRKATIPKNTAQPLSPEVAERLLAGATKRLAARELRRERNACRTTN